MNIIYKPNVISNYLTGNTNDYIAGNSAITSNIYIASGFTFNLNGFDRNIVNRLSIIDNLINYINNGINKYMLNVLIVDTGETYTNVTQIGNYCIKISYGTDIIDYFIMKCIFDPTSTLSIIPPISQIIPKPIITTTTTYIESPFIYYNSGETWNGSESIIPYDVFLHLVHDNITGWTSDSLKILFINRVIDCFDGNIPLSNITLIIFKNGLMLDNISEYGIYNIMISFTDTAGKNITNYILNIKVDDLPPIIYYYPNVSSVTGYTTDFYGITSGITISSGFTLSISENTIINRSVIINNVVEFVYDLIDIDINKYMLNILIVNSGESFSNISQIGKYCVKFSISDRSGNEVINYLIMNVSLLPIIIPILPEPTNTTTTTKICNKGPFIYYNSGETWNGSGSTIPYDIFLHLIHNGITGWTLDSLKYLFIDRVESIYDGNIPLSAITFILYKSGSVISLSGISESGFYDIYISYTDYSNNNIINWIRKIKIDDLPPVIFYRPYVLVPNLTGYTTTYSGASSAITSGIYISSGFTLNLGGFDRVMIDRLDIIENIVAYVTDDIDIDINKYMLNILIFGWSHRVAGDNIVYTGITQPGMYGIKLSISDSSGNEIINYLMMNVVFDVSVYSEGYWQDNKVWIDYILWLDHPRKTFSLF